VGMSVAVEDPPPLLWHAELGRSLPDAWTRAHHRGVPLASSGKTTGSTAGRTWMHAQLSGPRQAGIRRRQQPVRGHP
jgi:hypothetical protein